MEPADALSGLYSGPNLFSVVAPLPAPIRNTALWIVTSQSSDVSHHLLLVGDPMVSLGRVWISLSLPGPGGDHVMASASADCRSVTRV